MKSLTTYIKEDFKISRNTRVISDGKNFIKIFADYGLNTEDLNSETIHACRVFPSEEQGSKVSNLNEICPMTLLQLFDDYFIHFSQNDDEKNFKIFDVNHKVHYIDYDYFDTMGIKEIGNTSVFKLQYTKHNADVIAKKLLDIAKKQK